MPVRDNSQLWKYAGMAMQFFISIGIAVFLGIQVDKWLKLSVPAFALILPILAIGGIVWQVYRDTMKKK